MYYDVKSTPQIQKAFIIINRLKDAGFDAVIAGGAVRDMLLNVKPNDIDIATDARPDDIERLFEHTVSVGKAFGVIVVVIDEELFEVATFRKTHQTKEGSPIFGTMREDAKARDLTINAMFIKGDAFDSLEIIDYVGGQKDLKNKVICLTGEPLTRIREDFVRMLRVIRFAVKYDFSIDEHTLLAVKDYSASIYEVSPERIYSELIKILRLNKPRRAFELLYSTELLFYAFPSIWQLKGLKQPEKWHPEGDVFEHTIRVLENIPNDVTDSLRLAAMYHDVGKYHTYNDDNDITFKGHEKVSAGMVSSELVYFKSSNAMIETVSGLVLNHMKILYCADMRKSKLKKLMRLPYFKDLLLLGLADALGARGDTAFFDYISEKLKDPEFSKIEKLSPKPLITGKDLIVMGFEPGPLFSKILNAVENNQLDNILQTKEDALNFVRNYDEATS